ncbi:hypothetical protein O181_046573 [Austropuccinia psidii MF-1]|uniref:Phytanoyl-CoA dioxygenase family protein n=1 Tax=Austropuccinia psidii MF-1 TaxID=1389203 RepID=A0A9Q3HIP2_9BASI|nr:hypothetical protein [Austropuccinia psidii MF-1]
MKFHHTESDSIRDRFREDGFAIVQGLVKDSQQLEKLRGAADAVTEQTRNRNWPFKRNVGKQFPPWDEHSPDVWGVQHIMHPGLNQPAFAELYFSPSMLGLTAHLSEQSSEDDAMVGLFNLLVEPQEHHFELEWHRDSIKSNITEAEEQELLKAKTKFTGVQWNLALYHDQCLFVVPGSHGRMRTSLERKITINSSGQNSEIMPNQLCVDLAPGDAVFYDPEILHRGTYNKRLKRRTLHGLHHDYRADIFQSRGILQHFECCGIFYADPTFQASLPIENLTSKKMVERMIDWAARAKLAGVEGFAQENI